MTDAEAVGIAGELLHEKRITKAEYLTVLDGDHSPIERLLAAPGGRDTVARAAARAAMAMTPRTDEPQSSPDEAQAEVERFQTECDAMMAADAAAGVDRTAEDLDTFNAQLTAQAAPGQPVPKELEPAEPTPAPEDDSSNS